MQVPVENVAARAEHQYSPEFSSTPSDEHLHEAFSNETGTYISFAPQTPQIEQSDTVEGPAVEPEPTVEEEAEEEATAEQPKEATKIGMLSKSSTKPSKMKVLGGPSTGSKIAPPSKLRTRASTVA